MHKIIITITMFIFSSSALATGTSVYELDGSVKCYETKTISVNQSKKKLEQLGVGVISISSRTIPFGMSERCGTPTGRSNVLVVNTDDWKKLIKKKSANHGFGVWVFDQTEVEVYKYDGSLQCKRGNEVALDEMAKQLSDKGIKVLASRKGNDAKVHLQVCGASTGNLNVYKISFADLTTAKELGFRRLITKKMTQEIGSGFTAKRGQRGFTVSRPAQREPNAPWNMAIPKLW